MQQGRFRFLTPLFYIAIVGLTTWGLIYFINMPNFLPVAENTKQMEDNKVQEELKIEDLLVGTGAEAVFGKRVSVHYTGTLAGGTKFDSSRDRGVPFEFNLGAGEVIEGWDKGLVGMKVGGKRKLIIPPSLGYGQVGAGDVIPPDATLIFEIELLDVK